MEDKDVVEESMAAESQIDTARERTPSSIESTPSPEPDLGGEASQEAAPPQKRKGGRKPVCTMLDTASLSLIPPSVDIRNF